jgi:hypothetical protein
VQVDNIPFSLKTRAIGARCRRPASIVTHGSRRWKKLLDWEARGFAQYGKCVAGTRGAPSLPFNKASRLQACLGEGYWARCRAVAVYM